MWPQSSLAAMGSFTLGAGVLVRRGGGGGGRRPTAPRPPPGSPALPASLSTRCQEGPGLGEQGQVPAPPLPCRVTLSRGYPLASSVRGTGLRGTHGGEHSTLRCRGPAGPSQVGFLCPCAGPRLGTLWGHCQCTGTCTHPPWCWPELKIGSEKKCKACPPPNENTRVSGSWRTELARAAESRGRWYIHTCTRASPSSELPKEECLPSWNGPLGGATSPAPTLAPGAHLRLPFRPRPGRSVPLRLGRPGTATSPLHQPCAPHTRGGPTRWSRT